mgnify:CR=1 FL=1
MKGINSTESKKIKELSEKLAQIASKHILSNFNNLNTKNYKLNSDGQKEVVTQIDIDIHNNILIEIKKMFPNHNILSEEDIDSFVYDFESPLWIIDPLDGTTNFSNGLNIFASSISYIEDYKNRDIIKSQLYGASWEKNTKGYPYHKYIWEKREFCDALKDIGFVEVLSTGATKSHVPFRDMAVIFQKPNDLNSKNNSYNLDIFWKKKYGNKFYRFKVQTITIVKLFLKALNFRF